MPLIQEERIVQGLTQADLARRLGVSASAVSQAEKAEAEGTITLNTLSRFLSALGRVPSVLAAPSAPVIPVTWDPDVEWPVDQMGSRESILNARFRDRIPAIVGDCMAVGVPLTVEDLWLVADRTSVAAPLDVYDQACAVRDSYDRLLTRIANNRWIPVLTLPDGRRIPVPARTDDPASALSWAFTGIRNGADWLSAVRSASALLILHGHPWPVLPANPGFTATWQSAVGILRSVGNPDPLGTLILDAMRGVL